MFMVQDEFLQRHSYPVLVAGGGDVVGGGFDSAVALAMANAEAGGLEQGQVVAPVTHGEDFAGVDA